MKILIHRYLTTGGYIIELKSVDLSSGFSGLRHCFYWTYFSVLGGLIWKYWFSGMPYRHVIFKRQVFYFEWCSMGNQNLQGVNSISGYVRFSNSPSNVFFRQFFCFFVYRLYSCLLLFLGNIFLSVDMYRTLLEKDHLDPTDTGLYCSNPSSHV